MLPSMRQFLHKLFSSILPSIAWTAIILLLLCLPGGMFPKEEGFAISDFDKYVHATLFGGFVVLWCWYLAGKYPETLIPYSVAFGLFVLSCLFGIALEFVQKFWIPGRDYDPMDMVADSIGAFIGWVLILVDRLRRVKTHKTMQ